MKVRYKPGTKSQGGRARAGSAEHGNPADRGRRPPSTWEEGFAAGEKRDDGIETSTISGVPLKPLYTSADLDGLEEEFPGEFPYTRGVHPTGYRGRLWTMRQFSGFSTAEETNRRYHYLLKNGQTGLSV
ncbi:MAG TPA: methylmalonyl-CoA mutase family protein, partial [Candidatus Dormibacteraeota bacterium]